MRASRRRYHGLCFLILLTKHTSFCEYELRIPNELGPWSGISITETVLAPAQPLGAVWPDMKAPMSVAASDLWRGRGVPLTHMWELFDSRARNECSAGATYGTESGEPFSENRHIVSVSNFPSGFWQGNLKVRAHCWLPWGRYVDHDGCACDHERSIP